MLAEVSEHAGFWSEYFSLLSDPAHLAFEGTLILVIDVLIGIIVWPRLKAWHKKHDKEVHGV